MFNLTPWKKSEKRNPGALVERNEFPLNRIRSEFDALFDRFLDRWAAPFGDVWGTQPYWGFDLEDTDKEVVVRADAPGFEPDDFDVQVSGNRLTIQAERKRQAGEKQEDYRSEERRFQRTVQLPAGVSTDAVEARYRNGVLEVRLPKSPEAQGKRITVQAS
jgi:HSP20 family protein